MVLFFILLLLISVDPFNWAVNTEHFIYISSYRILCNSFCIQREVCGFLFFVFLNAHSQTASNLVCSVACQAPAREHWRSSPCVCLPACLSVRPPAPFIAVIHQRTGISHRESALSSVPPKALVPLKT